MEYEIINGDVSTSWCLLGKYYTELPFATIVWNTTPTEIKESNSTNIWTFEFKVRPSMSQNHKVNNKYTGIL